MDSTRCWKHYFEIRVHLDMNRSSDSCWVFGCTFMLRMSRSTTSRRCSTDCLKPLKWHYFPFWWLTWTLPKAAGHAGICMILPIALLPHSWLIRYRNKWVGVFDKRLGKCVRMKTAVQYVCMYNDTCDRVTWLYPCVAIDLIEVNTFAVIFCSRSPSNNHHCVF